MKFKKNPQAITTLSPFIDTAFICVTTTYFSAIDNTEPKKK